jgi:putative PIN family toxin of toxin-antitoxin system
LESRLWRPKFDRYVSIEDRTAFLRDLQAVAEWVAPVAPYDGPPRRDPGDEKFIAASLASKAVALVSGDQDLLVLKQVGTTAVVTAAQALRRLAAPAG